MAGIGISWRVPSSRLIDTAAACDSLFHSRITAYDLAMVNRVRSRMLVGLLICALLFPAAMLPQSQVAVLHTEGVIHGFLVLRTLDGQAIADGDVSQVAHGDRVTSHLLFHFKDASVHEETVVLSQRHSFRLISDHLVQKGSIFKNPVDVSINGLTGQFKVNYADDDGKKKTVTEV